MPTTIEGTSRQRLTTRSGIELHRQYIMLPASVWALLQTMCIDQHRSSSQVVESLITIASISGKQQARHDSDPR